MGCLLKVKSRLYALLKIIFSIFVLALLMKTWISGLSAATGLTAGTRNNRHDIERKTKGRGRSSVHHHLPLPQHLTAQCLCALPNSPVGKGRSLLESRGQRKAGLEGDLTQTAHTPMPETRSLKGLTSDRRPCFQRKARKYLEKKDSINPPSSHHSAVIFLQECSYKHVACKPTSFFL